MTSMSLNRGAMAVTISVSRAISQRAFRSSRAAVVAVPTRMSLMGGVARPKHRVKEARLLCVAGSSLMMATAWPWPSNPSPCKASTP